MGSTDNDIYKFKYYTTNSFSLHILLMDDIEYDRIYA